MGNIEIAPGTRVRLSGTYGGFKYTDEEATITRIFEASGHKWAMLKFDDGSMTDILLEDCKPLHEEKP